MSDKDESPSSTDKAKAISKTSKKRKPKLIRFVLDTNQLYTGSASDLLNSALRLVIESSRTHKDLTIEWYVPKVVLLEREYQMIEEAKTVLPSIAKLERLLSHNFCITQVILEEHVRLAINKQKEALGLRVLDLLIEDVDWARLINDAAFRNPPFEKGKTEKGFRDAIIAECFYQLAKTSPKSPSHCRVTLVTNDGLLADAIKIRFSDKRTIKILSSTDEVQSFINTLASAVTESFIREFRDAAYTYFFEEKDGSGLFIDEHLQEMITSKYKAQLTEVPASADLRENGKWYIGSPNFEKKEGQKITWRTIIRVESFAYKLKRAFEMEFLPDINTSKYASALPPTINPWYMFKESNPYLNNPGQPAAFIDPKINYQLKSQLLWGAEGQEQKKVLSAKGESRFAVIWSAIVTSGKKMNRPKILNIEYLETIWEQ